MLKNIPFIEKIYSRDDKDFYIYVPGTTHLEADRFGNPRYVYDRYYLDNNFNKYLGNAIPWIEEKEDASKWIKPTKEELEEYKSVLEQKETQIKKLA